jgi:hypothetical protein
LNTNNKIKENRIEENKTEEKEIELNKNTESLPSVSSSSVSSETSNTPNHLYNSLDIEEEIRTYLPIYITDNNFHLVEELYIQFKIVYPTKPISIEVFEKLYFFYMTSISPDKTSNKAINNWISDNNPTINVEYILVASKAIRTNVNVQSNYNYTLSLKLDSILKIEETYKV